MSNVCDVMSCERNLILQRGRKKNLVRDMAIYLARDLTGKSGVELGKYFGNICGAAITSRYNYIEKEIKTDRKLKAKIKGLKNRIINN